MFHTFNYIIQLLVRKDCKELIEDGFDTSNTYTINPDGGEPFLVSYIHVQYYSPCIA